MDKGWIAFQVEFAIIAFLSLLFAIGEILVPIPKILNWLLFVAFGALSVMASHAYFLFSGTLLSFPFLIGSYIPFVFILGPLFARFIFLRLNIPIKTKLWIHLIPFFLSMLAIILFNSDGGNRIKEILLSSIYNSDNYDGFSNLGYLNLHILIYMIHCGWRIFWPISENIFIEERLFRLSFLLLLFVMGITILSFLGFFFQNKNLLTASNFLLIFFLMMIYFFKQRYPSYFTDLEIYLSQKKYKNSRLKGLDLLKIKNELEQLMIIDKIYCEETVSLTILANQMSITSHQLSEYFNDILNKNFVTYINEFRIHDAQILLSNEPEMTILAIAYQVGFNSKSAFNAAFLKITGCTPSFLP
ncbi:MAG: helix-turn-helix domain-containing protein [Leptospiraceae bacterium]|nr:helix-turn-helix domain-containing protein [Leptospiraceae bacterium]